MGSPALVRADEAAVAPSKSAATARAANEKTVAAAITAAEPATTATALSHTACAAHPVETATAARPTATATIAACSSSSSTTDVHCSKEGGSGCSGGNLLSGYKPIPACTTC